MLLHSGSEQLPGTTELHRQGPGAEHDVVVLLLGDQLSHFSAASDLADHIKRWVVRQPAERFKPAEQGGVAKSQSTLLRNSWVRRF